MSFLATYHGKCAECEERIAPGEEIQSLLGDGYAHVECVRDTPERKEETCTKCFLIKPCECDS